MKITYVHHSCFSVEIEDVILLFDYYKGQIPDFDTSKHLFVFSSHKHQDHFDLSIFNLAEKYPNITFILSKDIKMNEAYMDRKQISDKARENILPIGPDECIEIPYLSSKDLLKIETLNSTDEGVAFIITLYNEVIYHAGDLNWWVWEDDTKQEYNDMTSRFQKEMSKIKDRVFSVAFLPLDPRQESRFFWGFDTFMKTTQTKVVFPMHFWMNYSVIDRIKELPEAASYSHKIFDIKEEGQIFTL